MDLHGGKVESVAWHGVWNGWQQTGGRIAGAAEGQTGARSQPPPVTGRQAKQGRERAHPPAANLQATSECACPKPARSRHIWLHSPCPPHTHAASVHNARPLTPGYVSYCHSWRP